MKKKFILVVADEIIKKTILESARRRALTDNNLFEISINCSKDDIPVLNLYEERRQKKIIHQKKREFFLSKQPKIVHTHLSGRRWRKQQR